MFFEFITESWGPRISALTALRSHRQERDFECEFWNLPRNLPLYFVLSFHLLQFGSSPPRKGIYDRGRKLSKTAETYIIQWQCLLKWNNVLKVGFFCSKISQRDSVSNVLGCTYIWYTWKAWITSCHSFWSRSFGRRRWWSGRYWRGRTVGEGVRQARRLGLVRPGRGVTEWVDWSKGTQRIG